MTDAVQHRAEQIPPVELNLVKCGSETRSKTNSQHFQDEQLINTDATWFIAVRCFYRITCPSVALSEKLKFNCSLLCRHFTTTDVPVVKKGVRRWEIVKQRHVTSTGEMTPSPPLLTCNTCLKNNDNTCPQFQQHPAASCNQSFLRQAELAVDISRWDDIT